MWLLLTQPTRRVRASSSGRSNQPVPSEKMREVALWHQVIKVTGRMTRPKKVASEFAAQRNLYYDLGGTQHPLH
jgi:hypothetical protein